LPPGGRRLAAGASFRLRSRERGGDAISDLHAQATKSRQRRAGGKLRLRLAGGRFFLFAFGGATAEQASFRFLRARLRRPQNAIFLINDYLSHDASSTIQHTSSSKVIPQ